MFQEEGHETKPFHMLIALAWVLEETSLESCMLYAKLSAKHRETSPCLIAHCLPQLAV